VRRTVFTQADQADGAKVKRWFDKAYRLGLKGK